VNTPPRQHSQFSLSKRSIGVAGAAAVVACAACCLAPFLAAARLASSAVTALAWLFRPGSELLVAGTALAVILGGAALRNHRRSTQASRCGGSCRADGGRCDCDAAMTRG
jgi:hypothetical protein